MSTMKTLIIRPADVSLNPLGAESSVADARVSVVYDRDVWVGGQPVPRVTLLETSISTAGLRVPVLVSDDPSITEGAGFVIKVIVETTPRIGPHNDSGTSLARTIQVVAADPDEIPLGSKPNLTPVSDPMQYADVMSAIKAAAETKAAAAQVKASADGMVADVAASKDAATQAASSAAAAQQTAANMVGPTDAGVAQLVQSGAKTTTALSDTIAAKVIVPTTSAARFGAVGDGTSNDGAALATAPAGARVYLPAGQYAASSSVTIAADLVPAPGARILVPSGVTVKVTGAVDAASRDIFVDKGGKVDLTASPSQYNLAWFMSGSGYINERWDFAKRSMATFVTKQVWIPRPYANQPGAVVSGTRPYWGFNGPISFTDVNNTLTVHLEAEFKAVANCSSFLGFTDAAKPEDVYFYGDLRVLVPPDLTVDVGIDMQACARVTFWGNVVINGAKTSVRMGSPFQVAPVGSIRFFQLQCSFFTVAAVSIYGKQGLTVQDIQIDRLSCTAAQVDGVDVVQIRGLVRNIDIGSLIYSTDTAKNGYQAKDAANVLVVESTADGNIFWVRVGQLYQANAIQGFQVRTNADTPQGADKIQAVTIERVHSKYQGVAGSFAACTSCEVRGVTNSGDINIASGAVATRVTYSNNGVRTVTDSGSYTLINGVGSQSRGSGVAPAPAGGWPVGAIVRETSDNKVYLRVANTNAASDFIALT